MKHLACLNCLWDDLDGSNFVRAGKFYRRSDSTWVQRFRCRACRRTFSHATFSSCYRQKKRHKNRLLFELLCSGVSQRRAARLLRIHRTTVVRKFLFLGLESKLFFKTKNALATKAIAIEFDDLETFEHSKCKPLSVTLAVEAVSTRILGFRVSRMPAKGRLVEKSRKLYGERVDERKAGRQALFGEIRELVVDTPLIRSDSNSHYAADVAEFFPTAVYHQVKGKRGAITGQGELKKVKFDPIFALNHTCARLRADVNRLIRKTWCTTKLPERLGVHLTLYARYHNEHHLRPLT